MRVIVCGGRDYDDAEAVVRELEHLHPAGAGAEDIPTIVHGGARGADVLAGAAGAYLGYYIEVFHADWDAHGKAAGPIRNQQMLDAGADLVIAFPGGRGTDDMVRRATKAGVPVYTAR